jgi:hypothetical protein
VTIEECRKMLIKVHGAAKDKDKRDAINAAIDAARANRVSFLTSHITVTQDYNHGYVVRID